MNLQTLQREVGEWSRRNFPGNQPWMPLLGVAEELLYEMREAPDMAAHVDALCDALIFLCDYCERSGLAMPSWVASQCVCYDLVIGRLCQAELKATQGIRGDAVKWKAVKQECVYELANGVVAEGRCLRVDFEDTLAATWAQVSKRDWRKDPEKGGGA